MRHLVWLALCFASLWAAPVQAVCPTCFIHTWPTDPSPCDSRSTLQQCVDGALAGSTVQIATNGPIDETISFSKSLTLEAAPGFHSLFSAGRSISAGTETTGSNSIAIEGLTLANGSIEILQLSADPLNVQVVGNAIESSPSQEGAIEIVGSMMGATGTVTLDISNNMLSTTNFSTEIELAYLNASGRIAGNTITSTHGSGAISIVNGTTSSSLDVIANRISGTYGTGIDVEQSDSGTTQVRILDNLVVGASGAGAAVKLYDNGGTLGATLVNNTLADGQYGLVATNQGASALSGLVANNAISGNAMAGILLDPSSVPDVANRDNAVFGNGSDTFTPGPGTISTDPQLVGSGNYHLKPSSPAIGAGDPTAVPSDLTADLEGNPRVQGGHVDIGALEAPAPSIGSPRAFTGELQLEIGGAKLRPQIDGRGTAVLNTSVVPPSFVIPAGAFVVASDFASFLSLTKPNTRQLVSLTGQNAQGSFDSQSRSMPLSGLLKFERLASPIVGTAMGSIAVAPIGGVGKSTALFSYFSVPPVTPISGPRTRTVDGAASLTGQSFAVSKDSRTPAGGGHIQLVAPFSFTSSLTTWSGPTSVTLALDFAPEPDRLAVGAVAIAVLCAVGLARRRRTG